MTLNMGTIDRIVRIIVGAALIAFALGLIGPAVSWKWVGWIGIIPIVTAFLGNCPAYSLLGISTR